MTAQIQNSQDLLSYIVTMANSGQKNWFGFHQQRITGIKEVSKTYMIDTYYIKLQGKANIAEELELDKNYSIKADCSMWTKMLSVQLMKYCTWNNNCQELLNLLLLNKLLKILLVIFPA